MHNSSLVQTVFWDQSEIPQEDIHKFYSDHSQKSKVCTPSVLKTLG